MAARKAPQSSALDDIREDFDEIRGEIAEISDEKETPADPLMLAQIEESLRKLGKEISELKRTQGAEK